MNFSIEQNSLFQTNKEDEKQAGENNVYDILCQQKIFPKELIQNNLFIN